MWSIINNNFICSEKELFRVNKIHLEKLLNMKSHINTKGPETPYFLKNKSYLRQMFKDREFKINNDNNIIYKKLMFTSSSASPYSKYNIPKYCPAFDRQRFNFDKVERQFNIYNDNISFYKRFSSKKSIYSAKKYLKKNDYENIIKHNISKSKFLPQITLKLCTYRQFRSNLLKESKNIKESFKKISGIHRPLNMRENLKKSKSVYDLLYKNKNYNKLIKNLRYKNKLMSNSNYLINSELGHSTGQTYRNKNSNMKRSQSAINIKLKNNISLNNN